MDHQHRIQQLYGRHNYDQHPRVHKSESFLRLHLGSDEDEDREENLLVEEVTIKRGENRRSSTGDHVSDEDDVEECRSDQTRLPPLLTMITGHVSGQSRRVSGSSVLSSPSSSISKPAAVIEEQIETIITTTEERDSGMFPSVPEGVTVSSPSCSIRSHQSSHFSSPEETSCDSLPFDLNLDDSSRVPFPELGLDLVDINLHHPPPELLTSSTVSSSNYSGESEVDHHERVQTSQLFITTSEIRLTDLKSWEENWLFQKKKEKRESSSRLYPLSHLDYAFGPIRMFIPNPDQMTKTLIGDLEMDQILDDLSEHNDSEDNESLTFSSSSDDEGEDESDPLTSSRLNNYVMSANHISHQKYAENGINPEDDDDDDNHDTDTFRKIMLSGPSDREVKRSVEQTDRMSCGALQETRLNYKKMNNNLQESQNHYVECEDIFMGTVMDEGTVKRNDDKKDSLQKIQQLSPPKDFRVRNQQQQEEKNLHLLNQNQQQESISSSPHENLAEKEILMMGRENQRSESNEDPLIISCETYNRKNQQSPDDECKKGIVKKLVRRFSQKDPVKIKRSSTFTSSTHDIYSESKGSGIEPRLHASRPNLQEEDEVPFCLTTWRHRKKNSTSHRIPSSLSADLYYSDDDEDDEDLDGEVI